MARPEPEVYEDVSAPRDRVFTVPPSRWEDDDQEGINLADYLHMLRRHKWGILFITLVAAVIGWVNALRAVPIYQASTKLLVEPYLPQLINFKNIQASPLVWYFYETQYEVIRSRAVLEGVVDELGLVETAKDQKPGASAETGSASTSAASDEIPWWGYWREWLPQDLLLAEPKPLRTLSPRDSWVQRIAGGLSVQGGKESQIISIAYSSADPEQAASIANAVARAYIAFGLESRLNSTKEATSWLRQRLEELRRKLDESEKALQDYQAREGLMVDSEGQDQIIGAKLGSLTSELVNAQTSRREAGLRYGSIQRAAKVSQARVVALLNEPDLSRLQDTTASRRKKLQDLYQRYGDKHPKIIAAKSDLAQATERLDAEISAAVERVRKDYDLARAREAEIARIIERQQAEISDIKGKAYTLSKLEREVASNRQLYETFLERFKEVDVAGEYDLSNVRVLEEATIPLYPYKPDKKRILLTAVGIGVLLGILFVFVREHLSNAFRTKEDIESRLNLAVLGIVPSVRRSHRKGPLERYLVNNPRSEFAESVNHIRTGIVFSDIDNPPSSILVTSAVASEGKSTLAANLALSYRQRGRTILVDGDLRKGRVSEIFGLKGRAGLTELVAGDTQLQDCVVQDEEVENLYILGAGAAPPNPLEVVSSQKLARTMEILRERFDYLIIDGSPVLPVSDSVVLGHLVDSILLVVKADNTSRHVVSDALARLKNAHLQPIGVVLSQLKQRELHAYAKYYGYYGGYVSESKPDA